MKQGKWLVLGLGVLVLFGCQSYRYFDPAKPHHGKDGFLNNYDNSPKASVLKWQWDRLTTKSPEEKEFKPEVLKTDMTALFNNHDKSTLTWIGHASFLLQLEGLNILTDPVFYERASPVSFMGPKRAVKLPFELEALPSIDVVLISHNHYDHLDLESLKKLAKRPNNKTVFLVPLGNAALLQSEGVKNVQEYDWWDRTQLKDVSFTLTPTQHWSARGVFDQNECLWGGWFIKGSKESIFFAGDTGYSKDFQDIAEKLGPVDWAMIPIGAYEPRWFMKKNHINPDEAVQIHKDLHAKKSIAIHWGTFRLSDEPLYAPADDLKKSLEENKISPEDFILMKHGETKAL
jgi:N-acyl-phosphatidylethanolamine-hydrolysing phospholipase D